MGVLFRAVLAAAAAWMVSATPAAQRFEPFVPVGVWYDALDLPSPVVLHDLQGIRAVGFNHVKLPVRWRAIEPQQGEYAFDRLDQLLTLAGESGLRVIVQPDFSTKPRWVSEEAPDLGLLAAFADAVMSRASGHPAFLAPDPRMQTFRVSAVGASDSSTAAARRLWRLDALRSAAGEHGWMAEIEVTPGSSAADVRQSGWAAIAHGARGVTFVSWHSQLRNDGLVERDGTIGDRARAAGEFAGVVARNAALFAPLRPRAAQAAIVYNPFWPVVHVGVEALASRTMLEVYERTFERNLPADFISAADVAGGNARAYAAALVPYPSMLPPAVTEALKGAIDAGHRLLAGARTALPTARGLEPDIRIENGEGVVQARFLQSPDALTFIALNYGESTRTATFRFTSGTPEAIWQNMESGGSVSFVQTAAGLTYRHVFPPRSALVLSIRTRLR